MEKEYYRIISVSLLDSIYIWEKAILVKANFCGFPNKHWHDGYMKFKDRETDSTDWFVFKYLDGKYQRLLDAMARCNNNEPWLIEKHIFTPFVISSEILKTKGKMSYFVIMWNDEYDYMDVHEGVFKPELKDDDDDEYYDDDIQWYDDDSLFDDIVNANDERNKANDISLRPSVPPV